MADAPSLSPRFLRRQGGDFDRVGRTLLSVAFDVDLDVDSDSDREGHGFSRTAKPPPKRDVIPLIPASRSISGCPIFRVLCERWDSTNLKCLEF